MCPFVLTRRPCPGAAATAFSFIPLVGDAYDVASALAGRDLLTGERLGGVGVAATLAGTILGSGRLAREGASAASQYVDITSRRARVWNRATDLTPAQFGENLMQSGFAKSSPADGIEVFTKENRRYVLRGPEHSNSGWTADVYIDDRLEGKIRLERP